MKQLALLIALVACDSNKQTGPAVSTTKLATAPKLALPVVTGGTAPLSAASDPPPVLLVLSSAGELRVGSVPTWSAISTFDPMTGKPAADLDELRKVLMEAEELHETPAAIVSFIGEGPRRLDDLLAAGSNSGSSTDDDASGGTGTAMALDEGKMRERPRVDPHAAAKGPTGELGGAFGPDPNRQATVAGELRDVLKPAIAVLLVDPHAKATRVIEVFTQTTGILGVLRSGSVVPLKLQVERAHGRDEQKDPTALDIHVHADSIDPDLTTAKAAMAKRDPWNPIDLLVDPDVDAQRLVTVIVQLDQTGAHVLGLGAAK